MNLEGEMLDQNMLTQAVNKLHANCNQIEIIKRKAQSDHKHVTMSAQNDSPQ